MTTEIKKIDIAIEEITNYILQLHEAAVKTVDKYTNICSQHEQVDGKPPKYLVRVKLTKNRPTYLTISWHRVKRYVFIRGDTVRTPIVEDVRKFKGTRYKMQMFPLAKDWEIEAISAAEDIFERIRYEYARCAKLLRAIKHLRLRHLPIEPGRLDRLLIPEGEHFQTTDRR